MNEFQNLHPLVIIGVGIAFGIIYFVSRGGFVTGKNESSNGKKGVEIVAVSADTGALNRAVVAVEGHTIAVLEMNKLFERNNDRMIDSIDEVRRELQDLNRNLRETNLIRVSHHKN